MQAPSSSIRSWPHILVLATATPIAKGGALGPVAWKGLTQPMGHFFFTGLPLLRSYAGTLSQHIGSLKETRLVRHPKKS